MTSEPKSVYEAMWEAAQVLTGKRCVVRMREPATRGSWGTTTVRPDGVFEIHVTPWTLGDQGILTFLHECAHVRLHGAMIAPSKIHKAPVRSFTVSKADKRPNWDVEADALRDQWLAYGKAHAPAGYSEDGGILKALMNYYD